MRHGKSFHKLIVHSMVAVLALMLPVFGIAPRLAHAANPVQVTVTILRFKQLQDPAGPFEQANGTYYGFVNIANQGYQDSRSLGYPEADHTPDISPYWQFSAMVDPSLGTIPIFIQVKDDDTGVPFSVDDVMDINPESCVRELHLSFNLNDGTWIDTDNNIANVGWSRGNGDKSCFSDGGEQGELLYDIGFGKDNLSGDGIPDGVKRFGVRDIDTGNLVASLGTLGADPCRKTVAVWIDYMSGAADGHTHKPLPDAISLITNAYNNAPVAAVSPCPYPGFPTQPTGIKLILLIEHAVPELATMTPDDQNYTNDKNNSFPNALSPYFFYLIMAHDQATGNSSSGKSCPSNSKDFEVSLGSWANEVGTATDQGSSIMHELGHCLGLGHGGGDAINCKPNYLSVMNYDFQITGIPSATDNTSRYDYSRQALPTLNESALSESSGLGGDGKDLTVWTPDNGTTQVTGPTSGPLDWDNEDKPGTTDSDGDNVSVDVNAFGLDQNKQETCQTGQPNPNPSPGEQLFGYDDWNNLKYRGPLASTAGGSGVTHAGDDINFPLAQAAKAFWATVFVTPTGAPPLSGVEGAALNSVTVASVTDSEPSATAANFTATIDWGDSTTSTGVITGPTGGPFTVTGSHTYEEEGTYTVTMTLRDQGEAFRTATTSATIADAPLTAQGTNIVTLNPFSGTVATFTDADPHGTVSDYTATIAWGDGSSSAGTVTANGSSFAVNGSHSYAALGPYTITVHISDAGGASTSATTNIILFAFPSGGDFTIGDGNAGIGTSVTFWGDQWARANTLSGGQAPLSFKGFENSSATPTCGSDWQTDPGNSAGPSSTVPTYMGVIVTSKVTKSGSTIFSGTTPEIVVVKTNPGYVPDPTVPGTGTVVAVFCHV